MLDNKDFISIGANVRDKYRTHIFTKALDVNDKPFSSVYDSKYKALKSAGKLPRQQKGFGKINSPIVSTDLLRDFGSIYSTSNNGFKMGWSVSGAKIKSLEKQKRFLTTKEKALPNNVAKFLDKQVDMAINKKLGGDTTTIHKIKK